MNREQYDILLFVSRQGKVPYFDLLHEALSLKSCIARHRSMRVPSLKMFFRMIFAAGISSVVDYRLRERCASSNIFNLALLRHIYAFLLRIEASYLYSCYFRFFERHPSRFVAVWNGYKFRMSIAVLVATALKRQVVYFENGLLPGTTTMDFKGINAKNSLSRDPGSYQSLEYASDVELPRKLDPRQAVMKALTTSTTQEIPERYIFVPFQIDNDSQILVNSPWIKDMRHLFGVIREIQPILRDTNISFVFKEHPSCTKRYFDLHELAKGNSKILILNDENTQKLIESAVAVLTVNSTVGMEALLCGKKVIVVGDACYAIEGLVRTASSEAELIGCVDSIDRWELNEKLRTNYLKYVYTEYSIPNSYRAATERHWCEIESRLRRAMS
jgi:capsular polysaccharide export protein